MKKIIFLIGAGLTSLVVGCATTPIALAPVGPNPAGSPTAAATGWLEVYSRLAEQSDEQIQGGDGSPVWYQHTDYTIRTPQGRLIKQVDNSTGHYAEAPEPVALTAGNYLVKAMAKDYSWVSVPVTIECGRTTRVHLDDQWRLPAGGTKRALVRAPNGEPVGWRAEPAKNLGAE